MIGSGYYWSSSRESDLNLSQDCPLAAVEFRPPRQASQKRSIAQASLVVMHLSSNALTAAILQMPLSGKDCSWLGGVPAQSMHNARGSRKALFLRDRDKATVCEKERGSQVMVWSSDWLLPVVESEVRGEGKIG